MTADPLYAMHRTARFGNSCQEMIAKKRCRKTAS